MKLSKKIIRYYTFSSLLFFLLGSIAIYFVLKSLIAEEVDETLRSEKKRIVKQLQNENHSIPDWATINLEIRNTPSIATPAETLKDTIIYVKETNETIPLRQLRFYTQIQNHAYQITLRRSLIEKDDLVTGAFGIMIGIFVVTLLIINAVNIWSEKKLWGPFYATLKRLQEFRLESKRPLNLPQTPVDEFSRLNRTLNRMAEKLRADYRNLKQFSENAAHEMQTPLAIIRSKLDVLIQDSSFSEEQAQTIHSLYQAVNRLARLNRSLNLLTKIENREFDEKQPVDFCALIKSQTDNLRELIEIKQLTVGFRCEQPFVQTINPFMAETLISNLLLNAIKHNVRQGHIEILITTNSFVIENSGPPLQSDAQAMFERFKKDRPASDSPGLGLSIVQSICHQNGLKITYSYQNKKHRIRIER